MAPHSKNVAEALWATLIPVSWHMAQTCILMSHVTHTWHSHVPWYPCHGTWHRHDVDGCVMYVWHEVDGCAMYVWHDVDGCAMYVWHDVDGCAISRGRMSRVALIHEWCHCSNESCHIYEWVTSHMNESCHTYEWVMSHVWMSHVACMNESCHMYERSWVCHVEKTNESCHTYMAQFYAKKWARLDVRMSHVTRKNESCYS